MKCPACPNELTEVQVGALAVDTCHGGCGGIWFDAFELQRANEKHETGGELLAKIQRDPALRADPLRKRDCPRCEVVKLRHHLFNPKSPVEVDHCPNCAGYWLDAGELEKIREETKPSNAAKTAQPPCVNSEVIRYIYQMQIQMRAE
jgi:uncharacterized protein